MAIQRSFETEQTDSNLNGASVTSGTNGAAVDLSSKFGVHGTIRVDFPTSPTDQCVVEIYTSSDGGTTWDQTPMHTWKIDNDQDPNQLAYTIEQGPHTYRLRCRRDGLTDTLTVTHKYRRWEVVST